MYASLAAAVDQLTAALPRVVELEQLLLLAEGAAAVGDTHHAADDDNGAWPMQLALAV
jgi:hypothetical protein